MKAIVKTREEVGFELLDVPVPRVGDDDVLIKVKAAAICGSDLKFYKGDGCEACQGIGYKGRIGIFEVLPVTQTIKELIVQEATADRIEEQAKKEGMITMVEDGFVKAVQGITSIEEVLRVIIE